MARKERNEVDYFPHAVNHGKKMFYMRATYGNDGYAVWFMLLEHLGKASYHYLDLSDEVELMYLSSEFKVPEITLKEIINSLVKLDEFDQELWEENNILFNEKFVNNISDAYRKRSNECVTKKTLFQLLEVKGVRKPSKLHPNKGEGRSKGVGNPQRIVKDRIVKDTKEEFTRVYTLFQKPKEVRIFPDEKSNSFKRFVKVLTKIELPELEKNVKNYLEYLDACTWDRKKKAFDAWINDPSYYANDWVVELQAELKKEKKKGSAEKRKENEQSTNEDRRQKTLNDLIWGESE